MFARLPKFTSTVLLVVGPLATLSSAWMPHCLDPVTTFTNGMPLPSTNPMRSHDVNYQGDEYRVGCIGGHYHLPCVSHAVFPNRCCAGQPAPPDACRNRVGSLESLEPDGVVSLGSLPAPMSAFGTGAAVPGGGISPSAAGRLLGR